MTPDRIRELLASSNPEERRLATGQLVALTGADVVTPLLRALGDEDWRVRKEAVAAAVASASEPAVLRALVDVLRATDDDVGRRNAAVEAMGRIGIATVDAISVALPSLDADGRKLAAEALGRTGADAALIVLRSMIQDPDPNVRVAAVEALASIGTTSVDAAVPVLEELLDDPDQLLRLTVLTGLNDLGVAVAFPRIAAWLDDPVLRASALVATGRRGDPVAAPRLVEMLVRFHGIAREQTAAALVDFVKAGPATLAAAQVALAASGEEAVGLILHGAATAEPAERRCRWVALLAVVGTEEAAHVAVRALEDDRTAEAAVAALNALGSAALSPLLRHIAAGPSETRAACVELVGQLAPPAAHPASVAVVRGLLEAPEPGVVAAALGVLATLGDASCILPAAQRLNDPSPWVRRAAAVALAGIAEREVDAARALALAAAPNGDVALAAAIVMGVVTGPIRPGDGADLAFLSQALAHGDPMVRRAALEALARRGGVGAVEAVAFALTDEEAGVRVAAAHALGEMRGRDGTSVGVDSLLAFVQRGGEVELVAEVARALGATGSPAAVPWLRQQVRDGVPGVAVAAVEAVAQIASEERVDALLEGIWHDEPEVVKAALQRLSAEKDSRVRSHLAACLDHEAWDVRRLAADLLGRWEGEGVTARLKSRLTREAEPLVREAIQRALVELESAHAGIRRTTTSPPLRGPEGE